MMQVQFFLFGLLVVWFTGTGKMRAFVDALRNEPAARATSGNQATDPSRGNRIVPNPPES